MRAFTSVALTAVLAGSLFGGIAAASADSAPSGKHATGRATNEAIVTGTVSRTIPAPATTAAVQDLPEDVSYGEAAAVNAHSPQDRYFYYDGQFHVSYPNDPAPEADKTATFYYGGQRHVSYATGAKSDASPEILNLPDDVAFGEAQEINSRSAEDHYFYYDGRFHISYQ